MASLFTNVVMESSSCEGDTATSDRKSTRLNSSHSQISYAVFCLKKKKEIRVQTAGADTLHIRYGHHPPRAAGLPGISGVEVRRGEVEPEAVALAVGQLERSDQL